MMKNTVLSILFIGLFISCSNNKDLVIPKAYSIIDQKHFGLSFKVITGEINEDIILTNDKNWMISGIVIVREGSYPSIDSS